MSLDQVDASQLEGKKIDRWHVLSKRIKTEDDDSGAFSSCYEVRDDEGTRGFLKAFNIRYAFKNAGRTMDDLHEMAERFINERELLYLCREKGMKRVVTAIDHGSYMPNENGTPIPYLVFEVADGSLKKNNFLETPDFAWKLRVFHGALVGTSQLHQEKIAHQDIKPSNILLFGRSYSKICDLGSATQFNSGLKWDTPDNILTDLRYIPIELLYGYYSSDWNTRRLGGDLFMLGGLLAYMLSGINVLTSISLKLPPELKYENYRGTYKDILPNIIEAFNGTMREIGDEIPRKYGVVLMEIISQLTHPAPEERGNPKKVVVSISQYSLSRYISIVDRIAFECGIKRR